MLNWLYTAITWILLRWHDVWSFLENVTFLNTNWDWVLSIVFLVITVRIILFPLFVKQIKSQRAMQALQPQVKALQEKHKGDRETLQKETMELYRREKANPLMGCLPIFLQVPVFISLFWILGRRLDPNRAWNLGWPDAVPAPQALRESNIELYGWTLDRYGSAAEAKLFNAPIAAVFSEFGWFERDMASHYGEMGTSQLNVMLVAGVLAVIMVVTTFFTSRQMILKTGWATDPTQLMMQRLMVYGLPLMLLFSGAFFPISVIIYWVINNLFSLGQQQWVLRKYPPPPTANAAKTPTTTPGGRSAGARQPSGKVGKGRSGKGGSGKDDADEKPAIDGKKLAPKPGAKPAGPKKTTPKKASKFVPPKGAKGAPAKKGIPAEKPAGSGAGNPAGSDTGESVPPSRKGSPPAARTSPDGPARGGSGRSRRRSD